MNRTALRLIKEAKAILQRQVPDKELTQAEQKAVEDYCNYVRLLKISCKDEETLTTEERDILAKAGLLGLSDDEADEAWSRIHDMLPVIAGSANKAFEDAQQDR